MTIMQSTKQFIKSTVCLCGLWNFGGFVAQLSPNKQPAVCVSRVHFVQNHFQRNLHSLLHRQLKLQVFVWIFSVSQNRRRNTKEQNELEKKTNAMMIRKIAMASPISVSGKTSIRAHPMTSISCSFACWMLNGNLFGAGRCAITTKITFRWKNDKKLKNGVFSSSLFILFSQFLVQLKRLIAISGIVSFVWCAHTRIPISVIIISKLATKCSQKFYRYC